jgi:hypothetical protein
LNRTKLEHIIRAASAITGDMEIVVIGSQAIHGQLTNVPPIAFVSKEADVYPLNFPERSEDIEGALGEGSAFQKTFGYHADGVDPTTATLPAGWEQRLVRFSNSNTGGATGLCLDVHDLLLSKYCAGREKDLAYNRAVVRHGCVNKKTLLGLIEKLPVDDTLKELIRQRATYDFSLQNTAVSDDAP